MYLGERNRACSSDKGIVPQRDAFREKGVRPGDENGARVGWKYGEFAFVIVTRVFASRVPYAKGNGV